MPYDPNREALRRGHLRELWTRCPTPEVQALLWEIDRLHRLLDRLVTKLSHLANQFERPGHDDQRVTRTLGPVLAELKREPGYAIAEFKRQRHAHVQKMPGQCGPEPEPPP